jgi:hypothetical protein
MGGPGAQYSLTTVPTTRAPVPASSRIVFWVRATAVWFLRATTSASPVMGMPSSVGGAWRAAPPALDQHGAAIRAKGGTVFRPE